MSRITITDEMARKFSNFRGTVVQSLEAIAPLIEAQIDQELPTDRTAALHIAALTHNGMNIQTLQKHVERSAARNLRFIQTGSFDEMETTDDGN